MLIKQLISMFKVLIQIGIKEFVLLNVLDILERNILNLF